MVSLLYRNPQKEAIQVRTVATAVQNQRVNSSKFMPYFEAKILEDPQHKERKYFPDSQLFSVWLCVSNVFFLPNLKGIFFPYYWPHLLRALMLLRDDNKYGKPLTHCSKSSFRLEIETQMSKCRFLSPSNFWTKNLFFN